MSKQTDYWTEHFARCAGDGDAAMDSLEPLMISMYGFATHLIGAAALRGTVLDAGCGFGLLTKSMYALGAQVVGIDGEYVIEQNKKRGFVHADPDWLSVNLDDDWELGKQFDVVVCLESLQFVDIPRTVARLWRHVAPKGRLVFTLPNLANGINAEGHREHRMLFGGTRRHELDAIVRNACAGYEMWKVYGLHLGVDQRLEAYDSSLLHELSDPAPYRFLVGVLKP